MPIQFRCPSCDRMLGIAKRKAGSSVKCPRCAADVRVPALAGMAIETGGPVGAAPAIPKDNTAPAKVVGLSKPSSSRSEQKPDRKVDSMPLFERPDFEHLLNPAIAKAKPEAPPETPKEQEKVQIASTPTQAYIEADSEAIDVEDLSNTFILTRTKLMWGVAIIAMLMGLAFSAGYFLASATVGKEG